MTPSDYRREVRFTAGYDCIRFACRHGSDRCVPGGPGSHGRHGLEILWLLHGKDGAVQFRLMTGWEPEPADWSSPGSRRKTTLALFPLPADLGYHSYTPRYEGQTPLTGCPILDGKPCFYDGSGLNAEQAFTVLCNGGDEELWVFLEQYYATVFADAPFPEVPPYPYARRHSRTPQVG